MYIKIKNKEKWVLIDTPNIFYNHTKVIFNNVDDIDTLFYANNCTSIIIYSTIYNKISTITNFPIELFYIIYDDKKRNKHLILFDELCYICNENGKTIETLK
jgi:hypothetical protein